MRRHSARTAASSSPEAVETAVELHLREHRLDHRLSAAVEPAAAVGGQDATHEVVVTAVPVAAGRPAAAGVRRDQHLNPAVDDALHLLTVPVTGGGEDEHDGPGEHGEKPGGGPKPRCC